MTDGQTFVVGSEGQRARCVNVLQRLPLEKPWEVTIKRWHAKRSIEANRRLWALHQLAAEHVGCTAEAMHEDMLCQIYGCTEVKLPSGYIERIPLERSSSKNKKEFAQFMEKVEAFYISELGVFLGD